MSVLNIKENTISNMFTIYTYMYFRNTYPKVRALMKMYRVVPQTKRELCIQLLKLMC